MTNVSSAPLQLHAPGVAAHDKLLAAMKWLGPLVLCSACGRLGFDPAASVNDGAVDSATLDGPRQDAAPCAWGPAERLPFNVQSTDDDWEPALHPDGVTLIFSSDRDGVMKLYRTIRNGAAWSEPALASTDPMFTAGPTWNAAGTRLYFTDGGLWSATFDGTNFGSAQREPSTLLEVVQAPTISTNELEIFFTDGSNQIRRATRTSLLDAWVSQGVVPELGSLKTDGWPSLTNADLTLYFESTRTGMGSKIFVSHRAAIGMPFDPPTAVDDINNLADPNNVNGDPDAARDDRTLVFSSDRAVSNGGNDLFIARRLCP